MMKILLTCVGRRKYLVDYFKAELGLQGKVIGADMTLSAPGLAGCDKGYRVPAVDSPDYINELLSICQKEAVDALISLNDLELPVLARAKPKFEAHGVKVIVSSEDVIETCGDKWATVLFAKQMGIPAPQTFLTTERTIEAISSQELNFPLIIKPRWGSASIGLYIVHTIQELEESYAACKRAIANSFLAQLATDERDVLIQEMIVGSEFGVDVFNDLTTKYRGSVLKKKVSMRAGETDKAQTVQSVKLASYADRVGEGLKHIGNLDCDFLERDGEFYLLEMNPRFGGGYPFSHEAGGNLVRALLQSLTDENDQIEISYQAGLSFAKCDVLVAVANDSE